MELNRYKRTGRQTINMLTVTTQEATELILSLSSQLVSRNSNHNRLESTTTDNEYFSIAVDFCGPGLN